VQSILVTGASSGFGAAIARRFLKDGKRVIAAARRKDRLDALASEFGRNVLALELDVTDHETLRRKLAELPSDFAEIDVLINNAGMALGLSPAQEADLDEWDRMIATNCAGLVHATRAVLPAMVARGRGTVVNIGSVAGAYPYPGANVYGASKAFVHQFTQNLNADLVGTGVRASCIEPGLVGGTEFSQVRFSGDGERAAAVYQGTEALTAEDVADAVHWIVSLPPRVTINNLMMMPNCQSFAGTTIKRR
jgi:3-hydroxy acid dehydrogenase/malonic semialdehyde reductase